MGTALSLMAVSPLGAQTPGTNQQQSSQQQPSSTDGSETRPATTTTIGDTGLWFTPLAEVLPKGKWSASAYRVNWDRTEAFSDISDFTGTFAFGASDRVEVFGGIAAQRRIDADRRPVRAGGTPMDYPTINQGWQTGFGDVTLGAKFNMLSQFRQNPTALAIRGVVKLPTASDEDGLGSKKPDFYADVIVSREFDEAVDLSGYGGLRFRGEADGFDQSHGARWGVGVGWPSRSVIKIVGEVNGEFYFDDLVTTDLVTIPENAFPASWTVAHPVDANLGLTFQKNGFFVGAGLGFGLNTENRGGIAGAQSETGDRLGFQARIGYHRAREFYVAPPPPRHRRLHHHRRTGLPRSRHGASPAPSRSARRRPLPPKRRIPMETRWPISGRRPRARSRTRPTARPSSPVLHKKAAYRSRSPSTTARAGRQAIPSRFSVCGPRAANTRSKTCTSTSTATRCDRTPCAFSTRRSRPCRRIRRSATSRGAHLQHRHDRIQPRARRAPLECGA